MTHEFKQIVYQALAHQKLGQKTVLATVVHLEGSSYRKPGVRMLIAENGSMTGAVSGGCVEADIKRRAASVFQDGKSKIMTYDGRYRLGCEGLLYILIEPFAVSTLFLETFHKVLEGRESFVIESRFQLEDDAVGEFGSVVRFKDGSVHKFHKTTTAQSLETFIQTLSPSLKLLIIGAEHDAVKLCSMASLLGWEVDVLSSLNDPKTLSDFPGAKSVVSQSPELMPLHLDPDTVVVLMTHSYAQDLKYLVKLADFDLSYLGILGSRKRRQRLQNDVLNYKDDCRDAFLASIYSPAGLNIGAITPEEIALSILSEILAVVRGKDSGSLRDKPKGKTMKNL